MNIGDRVIVNGVIHGKVFINSKGKLIDIVECFFAIEFDEYIDSHSCNGKGKNGYCWNVYKEHITLEKDQGDIISFIEELDKITL